MQDLPDMLTIRIQKHLHTDANEESIPFTAFIATEPYSPILSRIIKNFGKAR